MVDFTISDFTRVNAGRGESYYKAWVHQYGERFPVSNGISGIWRVVTDGGSIPLNPAIRDELNLRIRQENTKNYWRHPDLEEERKRDIFPRLTRRVA